MQAFNEDNTPGVLLLSAMSSTTRHASGDNTRQDLVLSLDLSTNEPLMSDITLSNGAGQLTDTSQTVVPTGFKPEKPADGTSGKHTSRKRPNNLSPSYNYDHKVMKLHPQQTHQTVNHQTRRQAKTGMRKWTSKQHRVYDSNKARRVDQLEAQLAILTGDINIPAVNGASIFRHSRCPRVHEPRFHCDFCIDLLVAPRSQCWTGCDDRAGGQCPCSAHDSRGPLILGADGRRKPENLAGVDPWDLEAFGCGFNADQSSDTNWVVNDNRARNNNFSWK